MIISIMNTDDLLRYTKPTSELEIALYNALQEQVTQGNIEATREIERLEDIVEELEEYNEKLKEKIEDLEYEILEARCRW
jgi:predicted  nucleic acid-binding Zn-ribbon protein